MTDPVRLYNPNPDAPNVWGAPPTKRNALAETLANIPSPFDVFSPPPEARKAYGSLAQAVVDMTSPAAVRDTVDASGQTVNALREGRGWDAAGGAASMLTAAAGVVPGGRLITKGAKELAQPIRAYHGSPHDFDRFDMSKIGTGEGAQAYGHGLYFAEREGTARSYRDNLAGVDPRDEVTGIRQNLQAIVERGQTITPDMVADEMRKSDTLRPLMNNFPLVKNITTYINGHQPGGTISTEAMYALRASDKMLPPAPKGHMYEVNIHADPNAFLDWDKPLSGQTPNVQGALRDIGFKREFELVPRSFSGEGYTLIRDANGNVVGASNTHAKALENAKAWADPAGPAIYGDINKSAPEATNALREAGIPGIKYLDGGSRAAGDGSHNYVAFDDKLIEILRKYGLLPVAAGTAVAGATLPQEGGDY